MKFLKRKLLLIGICFGFITSSTAQEIDHFRPYSKFEFEFSALASGSGFFTAPTLIYGKNTHTLSIAPLIPMILNRYSMGQVGVMGSYRFFPNQRGLKTDFFFSWNGQFFPYSRRSYRDFSFYNTLGYGFELRIFEELYFTKEVGAGVSSRFTRNYWSNNHRWSHELTGLLRIGIKKRLR